MDSNFIYAIDFGTSNSLLAAIDENKNHGLLPLDPSSAEPSVLRSLVYFEPRVGQHFGNAAIEKCIENEMNGRFLRSFKRFLPIKSFEGTLIDNKHWTLEELIARFLREMRERANAQLNQDVRSVVLGRPALFSEDAELDQLAHSRLENAAKLAGFSSIEFLPEPVAAAYRFRLEMKKEEIVLVADFGGGTSDYTILKLSPKEFTPQDVLSIGGAPVAGDALDGEVMRHRVAKNFGSEVKYQALFGKNILQMPKGTLSYLCSTAYINLLNSKENREFLRQVKSWTLNEKDAQLMSQLEILLENQLGFSVFEAIEAAKKSVSLNGEGAVSYSYPGIRLQEKITAKQFESYTESEIKKIFTTLDETLKRANISAQDIDRVCCTGGSAKVSLIQKELASRFGQEKLQNFRNFTSIVEGLGERARQILQHKKNPC